MIPILINHDTNRVAGKLYKGNDRPDEYFVTFNNPIPKNMMLNCGYEIIESETINGEEFIKTAKVYEFSLDTTKEFIDFMDA